MADIELVIKMPEEQYEKIRNLPNFISADATQLIRDGIPLPKGHGRLKDIDKIISDGRSKGFCEWYDEMKYAPTIIEADKENEKDEHMTADEFAELFTGRDKE